MRFHPIDDCPCWIGPVVVRTHDVRSPWWRNILILIARMQRRISRGPGTHNLIYLYALNNLKTSYQDPFLKISPLLGSFSLVTKLLATGVIVDLIIEETILASEKEEKCEKVPCCVILDTWYSLKGKATSLWVRGKGGVKGQDPNGC